MLGPGMWTPKVSCRKQQDEPGLIPSGVQVAVEKACCINCDENGHDRDDCPHKYKKWYQVPPILDWKVNDE
eukprot:3969507-Ditylum_brightwellii.AAC.1